MLCAIATSLSCQEWLHDRCSPWLRLLGRCPGSAELLQLLLQALTPRLLRAATRRARHWGLLTANGPSLLRRLLLQGNLPHHLLGHTSRALTPARINQERDGFAAIQTWPATQDAGRVARTLAATVEQSLSPAARRIFRPLVDDFCRHAEKALTPSLRQVHLQRPKLHLARQAWELSSCMARLCERLAKDQAQIKSVLSIDLDVEQPIALSLGCGDQHRNGDATAVIRLRSGRALAHKPRDMRLEATLQHMLKIPPTLALNDYGYQLVVHSAKPGPMTGRALGQLIAALDVLGAVDLHRDNLVINGDQGWLIDGEAVLHRPFRKPPSLGDSVLALGVVAPPVQQTLGSSKFWVCRHGLESLTQAAETSCRHHLVDLSPAEHNVLEAYKEQLQHPRGAGGLSHADINALAGLRRRVVMRPTLLYSNLLRALQRVNGSPANTNRVLEGLVQLFREQPSQPVLLDLARAEALELARGHIPFFTTAIASRHLDAVDGVRLPARSHREVIQDALKRQRLRARPPEQERQVALLRAALCLVRPPQLSEPIKTLKDSVKQAQQRIIQHLHSTAVHGRGTRHWLTLEHSDDRQSPHYVLAENFYKGARGIALGLRWIDADAEQALEEHQSLQRPPWRRHRLRANQQEPELAALCDDLMAWGLEGNAAGGRIRSRRLAVQRSLQDLERRMNAASGASKPPSCDLISGLAGIIAALQQLRRNGQGGRGKRLHLMQLRIAEQLLQRQEADGSWPSIKPVLCGLTGWSHGTAGIAAALAVVSREAPTDLARRCHQAISRALKHELNWIDDCGDWIDRRSVRLRPDGAAGVGQSWCHGAPGALLAAVVIERQGLEELPGYRSWRDLALTASLRARPVVDSLCCGTAGLILILECAAKTFDHQGLTQRANMLRDELASRVCQGQALLGDLFPLRYHPPGLFDGYAGIGVALHCRGQEKHIQSLLSFGLL